VLALLVLVATPRIVPAQTQTASLPALTPEQMETFLLQAKIVKTRSAGSGVTDSKRATLNDGTITHDAHLQFIDESATTFSAGKASELNFKDSYRYNIAGYRVAHLLGLRVPVSVERKIEGKPAAVTWWVDDVQMDEGSREKKNVHSPNPARFQQQVQTMRIFDELIQNKDRNQGNILWTKDWDLWMIDHTRAFRIGKDLVNPKQLLRCDRTLYAKLRGLTRESVAKAVGDSLTGQEISALMARRDAIVKLFEQRIAERGEAVVLYTEAVPATE
jgi:hypothetical protein